MNNILEIQDPCIVVVLPREYGSVDIIRMDIGNGVLVCIPATKAEIETSHEGSLSIHKAELLMVRPVKNHIFMHSVYAFQSIAR